MASVQDEPPGGNTRNDGTSYGRLPFEVGKPFKPIRLRELTGGKLYPPAIVSQQYYIRAGVKLTYAVLYNRAGENDRVWPSYKTIARDAGKSERQVRYDIELLKTLALIKTQRGRRSNTYCFLWHEMFEWQPIATQDHQGTGISQPNRPDRQSIANQSGNPLPSNSPMEFFHGDNSNSSTSALDLKRPAEEPTTEHTNQSAVADSARRTEEPIPAVPPEIAHFRERAITILAKNRGLPTAPPLPHWAHLYQQIVDRDGSPDHFLERLEVRKAIVTGWGILAKFVDDIAGGRKDWEKKHHKHYNISKEQPKQQFRMPAGDRATVHLADGLPKEVVFCAGNESVDTANLNTTLELETPTGPKVLLFSAGFRAFHAARHEVIELRFKDGMKFNLRPFEPGEEPGDILVYDTLCTDAP